MSAATDCYAAHLFVTDSSRMPLVYQNRVVNTESSGFSPFCVTLHVCPSTPSIISFATLGDGHSSVSAPKIRW